MSAAFYGALYRLGISVPNALSAVINFYCLCLMDELLPPSFFPADCDDDNIYKTLMKATQFSYLKVFYHSFQLAVSVVIILVGHVGTIFTRNQDSSIIVMASSVRGLFMFLSGYIAYTYGHRYYPLIRAYFFWPCSTLPDWADNNLDCVVKIVFLFLIDCVMSAICSVSVCRYQDFLIAQWRGRFEEYELERAASNPEMVEMEDMPKLPSYEEAIHLPIATRDQVPLVTEVDEAEDCSGMEAGMGNVVENRIEEREQETVGGEEQGPRGILGNNTKPDEMGGSLELGSATDGVGNEEIGKAGEELVAVALDAELKNVSAGETAEDPMEPDM